MTPLSRRNVLRGAAWTVPAVTVVTAAPAFAASPEASGTPISWYAESLTQTSLADYSNNGYVEIYVHHDDPSQPGYLKVMHWAYNNTLYWRPAFGAGFAMTGAVITFTLPNDQVLNAVSPTGNQFGVAQFNAFTSSPAGKYIYEQNQWSVAQSGNTVTLTYSGDVPAQSAAGWVFTSKPVSGTVDPNYAYHASATLAASAL
ncbi:MAG: hypothetical protein V9G04_02645 [Nocardioides sp.]